ncbi:MAG: histidine kinase [Candidatus Binatia bacterium]|nr:MAG: histidine kinase [Candidatus Binatia bacterium]GIW42007.1 MAG: histidine kinase [Candidatus Binatia bacterium]
MATVRDLMVTELVTVEPQATVLQAVEKMCRNRVGAVLVVENDELLGLFSERDLMTRVVAERRDPAKTKVGSVCTGTVVTIDVQQPFRQVLEIFRQKRFRHLPVLDGSKPVGILSTRDFLAYLVDGLERFIDEAKYREALAEGVDIYDHLGGSYGL